MGVLFILLAKEDPLAKERASKQSQSFLEKMAPLKDLRAWRFALYYFFMFGAVGGVVGMIGGLVGVLLPLTEVARSETFALIAMICAILPPTSGGFFCKWLAL